MKRPRRSTLPPASCTCSFRSGLVAMRVQAPLPRSSRLCRTGRGGWFQNRFCICTEYDRGGATMPYAAPPPRFAGVRSKFEW